MIRFIINFFLFGLLFYLIHLFFPEAFQTLVSWADRTYEYMRDFFISLTNQGTAHQAPMGKPENLQSFVPAVYAFILRKVRF